MTTIGDIIFILVWFGALVFGIIPPFMDLDVNVIDDVIEKVEEDVMPMVQDIAQKGRKYIPGI